MQKNPQKKVLFQKMKQKFETLIEKKKFWDQTIQASFGRPDATNSNKFGPE